MRKFLLAVAIFMLVAVASADAVEYASEKVPFGFNYLCDRGVHNDEGFISGRVVFDSDDPFSATKIWLWNGTPFHGDPNGIFHHYAQMHATGYLSFTSLNNNLGFSQYYVSAVIQRSRSYEFDVQPIDRQVEPCANTYDFVTMQFDVVRRD